MEITNMSNDNGIKAAVFTIGKKSFYISFWSRSNTVNICAINASAKAWGAYYGKSFSNKTAALANYKSQEAKEAIEKASALFQF